MQFIWFAIQFYYLMLNVMNHFSTNSSIYVYISRTNRSVWLHGIFFGVSDSRYDVVITKIKYLIPSQKRKNFFFFKSWPSLFMLLFNAAVLKY